VRRSDHLDGLDGLHGLQLAPYHLCHEKDNGKRHHNDVRLRKRGAKIATKDVCDGVPSREGGDNFDGEIVLFVLLLYVWCIRHGDGRMRQNSLKQQEQV